MPNASANDITERQNYSARFATNFAEYMMHPDKYPELKDEIDEMLGVSLSY